MCCRCRDMGMVERVWMVSARDESGKVRHVDEEKCTDFIGNGAEFRKVDLARIGRTTRDDELGFVLFGEGFNFSKIDQIVVFAHTVLDGIEPFSRLVGPRAVG